MEKSQSVKSNNYEDMVSVKSNRVADGVTIKGMKNVHKKYKYKEKILILSALSCNNYKKKDDLNVEVNVRESQNGLKALSTKEGLQDMLAAQMISIHRLQQFSIAFSNEAVSLDKKQYYVNTAIKLANTFVQQANLLSKLQGYGGQGIIVERVDVHNGGQAVVGTINSRNITPEEKK